TLTVTQVQEEQGWALLTEGRQIYISPDGVDIAWNGGQYRFNAPSEACPEGFGQEEIVKKLFARPFRWTPIQKKPKAKKEKKELLGFRPGKTALWEAFAAHYYTDNTEYTDEALRLLYRACGALSPEDIRKEAQKEIAEKGLAKKDPLLTEKGLSFSGTRLLDLEADTGPSFSLFIRLALENAAFQNDLVIASKCGNLKNGFYIKYEKAGDEFRGEIFDGSGKSRRVVFPYPRDEKEHVIGLIADGKSLTGWLDGRKCASVSSGRMLENGLSLALGGENLRGCVISDIKLFNYAIADREAKAMCR
ncbi:MAG: hypothetical protein ILO36_01160, partial [Abditibacteriota bacterium]|nr:hypothetical protein [Abditibacteriota bacterium]